MLRRDEARPVPVSRPHNRRGNAGPARATRRRRRPRAGRWAEPGSDHGVPAGAAASIWSTSTASTSSNRIEVENGRLCIGAGVRHAAFEKPVEDGPLGQLLTSVVPPHRASSDPHPRHLLRQHRPRRPGLRMVRGRGGARRRDGGRQQASRHARHPGAGLLRGHHDDGAGARTNCCARCGCRLLPKGTMRALPSSAAAPATSPSRWRWRSTG